MSLEVLKVASHQKVEESSCLRERERREREGGEGRGGEGARKEREYSHVNSALMTNTVYSCDVTCLRLKLVLSY